jgi:hypothetical protein
MGWVLGLQEIFARNWPRMGAPDFLSIGSAVGTRIADKSVVPCGV